MIKQVILKEEDNQLFVYCWDMEKPNGEEYMSSRQIGFDGEEDFFEKEFYEVDLEKWQQSAKKYPIHEDYKDKFIYETWLIYKWDIGVKLKLGIAFPTSIIEIVYDKTFEGKYYAILKQEKQNKLLNKEFDLSEPILAQQKYISELEILLDERDTEIDVYKEVLLDKARLVKEIDVIINGENAANQASLCDIVGDIKKLVEKNKEQLVLLGDMTEGLREHLTESYALMTHCVDLGFIDLEDESIEGVKSFNESIEKSNKLIDKYNQGNQK